jgi:hypothetical protein
MLSTFGIVLCFSIAYGLFAESLLPEMQGQLQLHGQWQQTNCSVNHSVVVRQTSHIIVCPKVNSQWSCVLSSAPPCEEVLANASQASECNGGMACCEDKCSYLTDETGGLTWHCDCSTMVHHQQCFIQRQDRYHVQLVVEYETLDGWKIGILEAEPQPTINTKLSFPCYYDSQNTSHVQLKPVMTRYSTLFWTVLILFIVVILSACISVLNKMVE